MVEEDLYCPISSPIKQGYTCMNAQSFLLLSHTWQLLLQLNLLSIDLVSITIRRGDLDLPAWAQVY